MQRSAHDLVRGVMNVVSLPAVYFRLTEAMNLPNSSAASIANVLSEDPGLTVRLLRVVNSAIFGFPSKIETASRAIAIIGTHQLKELALATSVIKAFKNVPPDLVNMEMFWRHSIACGLFARVIAAQRGEQNIERYFVAGLLHDVGRLIFYMQCPKQIKSALDHCQQSDTLLYKAEASLIGYTHAFVGQSLLSSWNLPHSHREAVGFHHNPTRATQYPLEAAVVHIADILANALDLGSSGERFVPPLVPEAWDLVGLKPEMIPVIQETVVNLFEDTVRTLM